MNIESRLQRAESLLRIARTSAKLAQLDFVTRNGIEHMRIKGEIAAIDAYFADVAEDEREKVEMLAQDAHDLAHDLQEPQGARVRRTDNGGERIVT